MANMQGPVIGMSMDDREEACKQTQAKKREQKTENTAWGKSGIISEHRSIIQQVATDEKVVIYFRQTKSECEEWIRAKHRPKPHSILAGTTITGGSVDAVQAWLDQFFDGLSEKDARKYPKNHNIRATSNYYSRRAADYIGITANTQDGRDYGKPIQGSGKSSLGASYNGKWVTGDYDLFQVVTGAKKCEPVCQDGANFARLKNEINRLLKWDAIQHGPQAQWCPTEAEIGDLPKFSMPERVKTGLQTGTNPEVQFAAGRKGMKAIDSPLTVVAGNGVVIALESEQDVRNALICEGCAE